MTDKKDLKRRIRERMTKTGESYTAARSHVLADREPPAEPPVAVPAIKVVEPRDASEEAARLGMPCGVFVMPGVPDVTRALVQLRDALVATAEDPELATLRGSVLRGERPPPRQWKTPELRQWLVRARAGIAGTGPGGWALAYVVDGEMLLATLSAYRASGTTTVVPRLWIRGIEEAAVDELVVAGIPLRLAP